MLPKLTSWRREHCISCENCKTEGALNWSVSVTHILKRLWFMMGTGKKQESQTLWAFRPFRIRQCSLLWSSTDVCVYYVVSARKAFREPVLVPYTSLGQIFRNIYRHTLFYCTSEIPRFLQTEELWRPHVEQVHQRRFSNSIYSLCVSMSRFGDSEIFQTS